MRDYIDLSSRNRIDFAQHLRSQFTHHDHSIGEPRDLFENAPLIRIRLAKNCMQRGHERHLQPAQQGQNVTARGSSIDAIFMLQTNKVVAIEVEEVSGSLVRG